MPRYPSRSWRAFRPDAPRAPGPGGVELVPVVNTACTILGLDPGSHRTGFGVVARRDGEWRHVAHGCIEVSGEELPRRLRRIFEGVQELVATHGPHEVAIERVFVNRNVDSALKLGQARGAAISALTPGTPVFEYAPRAVKKAMVGFGAAEKAQIGHMVKALLRLEGRVGADAADALAIALCHAHTRRLRQWPAEQG
jgi:crossover junction endodeoxyribonuclease RuvC